MTTAEDKVASDGSGWNGVSGTKQRILMALFWWARAAKPKVGTFKTLGTTFNGEGYLVSDCYDMTYSTVHDLHEGP